MKLDSFRYDINGLRACAVVLVILFHFDCSGFSAGYIGVDIFFVISGYLMTKIIMTKIENDAFSIVGFYLSRAIRIIPALWVLIFLLSVFGYFVLYPDAYKNFAMDGMSSLLFLSNYTYLKQATSYFATDAHAKVLLHTWSLSVEWQFYLLLPLGVVFFKKINSALIKRGFLLAVLASLIISIMISGPHRSFSFFMLPSRAWEMLSGGVLFLFCDKKPWLRYRAFCFYGGFFLVLLSLFLYNDDMPWPSYRALLPVLGAALIIGANHHSFMLSSRIVQFFGSISYSLYLWHWPILFFMRYFELSDSMSMKVMGMLLSVLFGYVSYRLIETPTRKLLSSKKIMFSYSIIASGVLTLCAILWVVDRSNGFDFQNKPYQAMVKNMKMPLLEDGWCFYSFNDDPTLTLGSLGQQCFVGSSDPHATRVLLFGDSFAGHNSPFWDIIGKDLNLHVQVVSTNWCHPSTNHDFTGPKTSRAYEQCLLNRQFLVDHIQAYDVVIFAGRWSSVFKAGAEDGVYRLLGLPALQTKKIIMMDEPYSFDRSDLVNHFKARLWRGAAFHMEKYLNNPKHQYQIEVSESIKRHMRPGQIFLTREMLYRSTQLTAQGAPYTLDGSHLSVLGSLDSAVFFEDSDQYHELVNFIS